MSQPNPNDNSPLDQVKLADGGSHPTATVQGTVSFVPGSESDQSSFNVKATDATDANTASKTRYEVHKHLGSGSFGSVSLAWDHQLQREVAIKRPRSGLPAAALQSFLREAQLVARLRHPSVVVVHDVQVTDAGEPFIVYEYLPGQSLRQRLKANEPLPLAEALKIALALAEGLAAAHKLGLTHRDLKPANVLFDAEGRPHIADFGLAIQEGQQRVLKGEVAGTFKYMAPEQVRGEAHQLDGRTDLWALGVILYEMLTGHQPFTGDDPADITDQILHRDPRPPRQWVPEIPKDAEQLVLKLLAKPMGQRCASAAEVVEGLRDLSQRAVNLPDGVAKSRATTPYGRLAVISLLAAIALLGSVSLFTLSPLLAPAPENKQHEPAVLNDEYFTPGAWMPLMRQRPLGVLPIEDSTVVIHEPYRVRVESEYPEFLMLGSTQARDYSYKVTFNVDDKRGQAGIFLGLSPAPGAAGQESIVMLSVVVDKNGIAVEPNVMTLQSTGKQKISAIRQMPRSDYIPLTEPLSLHVDISDGVISKVILNDHELMLDKESLDGLSTTGNFGIYNESGSHTFSNPVFRRR